MNRSPVDRAPQWAVVGQLLFNVSPGHPDRGREVKVGADWEELHLKQCSAEQLSDKNDR